MMDPKICIPGHNFQRTLETTPKGYWQNKKNQREFMDGLGKDLGFNTKEDWYKISKSHIVDQGGNSLLRYYGGSPSKLVQAIYPEHSWVLWRFDAVPQGYWEKKGNQREFLDRLGKELGFTTKEDWYRINLANIVGHGGRGLLAHYRCSPSKLVQTVYSEHTWVGWKFEFLSKEYWKNKEHQRLFMDHLGQHLGFKTKEEWYKITCKDIVKQGGHGLLVEYDSSPSKLVQMIYHEHSWNIWEFVIVPKGYWNRVWDDKEQRLRITQKVIEALQIDTMEDWYRVSQEQTEKIISGFDIQMLPTIYPDHPWDIEKLKNRSGPIKAGQRILELCVAELFPNAGIIFYGIIIK